MFLSDAQKFFEYALELFSRTGHTDADTPEFANHSARQFVYRDNEKIFRSIIGNTKVP